MHTAAPGHSEQGALSVAGCQAGFCPDCPCLAVAFGGNPWPEGYWEGAGNCQGFQTAVCCNPNTVKLQKNCIRWILSPFWSFGLEICLLDTEEPRWILGDSLFFLTPAEAGYAWKTVLGLAEVSSVGMFHKNASKESGVTHPWKHTNYLPRGKNFVLSAW